MGRVDPSLPQVFGRYLLVQRLSRGGMGEIFLAKHGLAGFEKLGVIKKVLPHLAADKQFISRFIDEAQVAIKLQHVNVAQVFEVGRVGDEYFLALEYVEGRDLRRILALLGSRKQRLPVDLALFIGREMANGLAYAHRRTSMDGASLNLVHCDISPPNILCSFEGETKVIDFGIAKSALRGTATDPKMGFGKFGYMAPEQLIRGGVVDHRTDIYAAGVVLFEVLTGQRLYEAGPEPDYRALAKKVSRGEHTMPSEVDKVLAPYDDLVATALRPKLEDRYQTAAEFRDAIQQSLVAVNPTISTDALGAYMRDLFAVEMTAQRELHERVAKAHLEDFQDQLTTQTGTTVSFALANAPAQAVLDAAAAGLVEMPGARAATTAAVPTTEVALADGTGAVPETQETAATPATPAMPAMPAFEDPPVNLTPTSTSAPSLPTRERLPITPLPQRTQSKAPLVAAILVGAMAAIVATVLVVRERTSPVPSASVDPKRSAQPQIRVESIPPEEQSPPTAAPSAGGSGANGSAAGSNGSADAAGSATEPSEPPKITEPERTVEAPSRKKSERRRRRAERETSKQPLTRDAVIAKYRAARTAYETYKAKNGGRHDQEWNDLASYVQYHPDELDELARRIESFRAKLRN